MPQEPGQIEAGHERCGQRKADRVHDEDEQTERQQRERERQQKKNRANQGVDEPEKNAGDDRGHNPRQPTPGTNEAATMIANALSSIRAMNRIGEWYYRTDDFGSPGRGVAVPLSLVFPDSSCAHSPAGSRW